MDRAELIWGMLFGTIGLAYFVYGKKQKKIMPTISGVALMLYPYFVTNTLLLVVIGMLLLILPYYISD